MRKISDADVPNSIRSFLFILGFSSVNSVQLREDKRKHVSKIPQSALIVSFVLSGEECFLGILERKRKA